MKLKLEALSPVEGIGIIRDDERTLRLVRPPYQLHDCPVLPEDALEDAILRHGFFASQNEFTTWADAIDFLRQQVIESRRALGQEIPASIPSIEILAVAPPEVLHNFLDRVENELIPNRAFDHAEKFLLALLLSDAVAKQPNMTIRAASLLKKNAEARKQARYATLEIAIRDVRFESLERHNQSESSLHVAERIKAQHSIFVPA